MTNQPLNTSSRFSSSIWCSVLITIGVNAVLPYAIYRLASPHMSTLLALLLAGIPPAVVLLLDLIRFRRLNLFGICALLAIALNLATGLLFKDARLLLVSYSLLPGIYGIVMLVSVLMNKPILLTLIRNTLANASPDEREKLEQRWLKNRASSFKFVTALWGVGLLSIPLISILLIYSLTVQQYAPIGPIIQYAMFGTLLLISHIYSLIRHFRKNRMQFQHHPA